MWVCHFESPVVGDIEKAAETPKILDSGMLIVNEHTRYQRRGQSGGDSIANDRCEWENERSIGCVWC